MKFIELKSRGGDYFVVAANIAYLRADENGQTKIGLVGGDSLLVVGSIAEIAALMTKPRPGAAQLFVGGNRHITNDYGGADVRRRVPAKRPPNHSAPHPFRTQRVRVTAPSSSFDLNALRTISASSPFIITTRVPPDSSGSIALIGVLSLAQVSISAIEPLLS
eukprot:gene67871-92997_t